MGGHDGEPLPFPRNEFIGGIIGMIIFYNYGAWVFTALAE
jgi:hypothetical protein